MFTHKGRVAVVITVAFFLALILIWQISTNESQQNSDPQPSELQSETQIDVAKTVFTELERCTLQEDEKYYAHNDFISIYDVKFRFNVIQIYLRSANISAPLYDFELVFKLDNEMISTYTIKYVFPETKYEILLPRDGTTSFKIISANWSIGDFTLSECKEFSFPVWLKGVNTLRYFSKKSILVRDQYDCVINILDLKGMGSVVLNQGASYYQEVCKNER